MKHPMIRSRRMRYGSLTVALTVTLIAALVLLNVIFSTLARRYSWYVDMTEQKVYSVTDLAHELISQTLDEAQAKGDTPVRAEIIFAENYGEYEPGEVGYYILQTARELSDAHPDVFELSWIDCILDVSIARELGVRNSNSVVLRVTRADGTTDRRVFFQQEFFTFEDGDTTTPVGYDGERVFATTLVSLLGGERPLACFTVNHDEAFYDQSLLYLVRDAGYDIMLLDLYLEGVPEDCELLITYNPNADFIVADGISEKSEIAALESYLAAGGKYLVYLSAATPVMTNFEQLLADWGVAIGRDYDELTEKSYNCMVKDTSAALTSDGFTILGQYVTSGEGARITETLTSREFVPGIVFRDATALLIPEGYTASASATYRSGSRTRSDVFAAGQGAMAWANGKQLDLTLPDGSLPLLSITTDASNGATLAVCGSTEFAAEDYLQSAVFGNADASLCMLREMGKQDVLIGLHQKPFATGEIASITTRQMTTWTITLTVAPLVLVFGTALVVLVRRKYS